MLFVLTLGIITGVTGITLVRQWLSGALASSEAPAGSVLAAGAFPHLAPPRRTPSTVYRLRRRIAA